MLEIILWFLPYLFYVSENKLHFSSCASVLLIYKLHMDNFVILIYLTIFNTEIKIL